jgi:hypothetical protein
VLSRADVVRVGSEEFRFYADVMISGAMPVATMPTPPAEAPAAAPRTPPPPKDAQATAPAIAAIPDRPAAPRPSPVADNKPTAGANVKAPAGAADGTNRAPPAAPEAPAQRPSSPDARPVLAVLEVINEGVARGTRYEVRVPLAHIGRGAHNDVVIDDDSVSDTHAKLQRREDGWYLIDLGSTNGTYVGGSRLTAHERRLDGAPDVRFGGVKLTFRPADVPVPAAKSTRAIASMPIDRTKLPPREPRPAAASKPAPAAPKRSGTSVWTWIAILIAAAAAAFYLLKS